MSINAGAAVAGGATAGAAGAAVGAAVIVGATGGGAAAGAYSGGSLKNDAEVLAGKPQYGVMTLGGYVFRINPHQISWNFKIKTNVQHTVGGRVVQVLGAKISDITIAGDFGQDFHRSANDGEGMSWRMAEAFAAKVRALVQQQSRDAKKMGEMGPPLRFTYAALSTDGLDYNYDFLVYIKELTDPDGQGTIEHRTGKFAYGYVLTLFPVEDGSARVLRAGGLATAPSVFDVKKAQAVDAYISRLADGIGWKKTGYNDPNIGTDIHGNTTGIDNTTSYVDTMPQPQPNSSGGTPAGGTPAGGTDTSGGSGTGG